jgi:uncharacterized protein YjbI with pentapeptide repeats
VVLPETHDAIPLEDVVLELQGSKAAIEIVGDIGAGKTTALADLAVAIPRERGFIFLDDATTASVVEAARDAVVVFTSWRERRVPGVVSYRLAPWDDDDLTEYLLAVHPSQCRSVWGRLQQAEDRDLLEGLPELWCFVLDRMAEDTSLSTVSDSLRQGLQAGLPDEALRTLAGQYCLDMLIERVQAAEENARSLRGAGPDARVLGLLRHKAVRLVLGGDRLARLLETEAGRRWLEHQLPRELVEMTAETVSSAALGNLAKWLRGKPTTHHAMAASILHAADTGWGPGHRPLPVLSGAYLVGARWKGVNLKDALLVKTDLGYSDLTAVVLDGATAFQARFDQCVLHRASLVKMRADRADFEMSVLTSANARSASLQEAILREADLRGACLASADLRGACLTEAWLIDADLTHADLTKASIDGAQFTSADLRWARLHHLTLRKAYFSGTRFAHAHLIESDLEDMELPGADFAGAHLEGALLTGSRMRGANFAGASLSSARLADVDWEGADLRDADLRRCTFHLGSSRSGLVGSPIACEGSRTGFYRDDFDQQTYRSPEEIRKANLRGADLRGAQIEGTDFYLVDLRDAKCTPEQFDYLRRCGAILLHRA